MDCRKQNSVFSLFGQIVFAALSAAAVLIFARSSFLSTGIEVRFQIECRERAGNHIRLSYKTDEKAKWKDLPPVPLKKNKTVVRLWIPETFLSSIRMELGVPPGKVVCSRVKLTGEKKLFLEDLQLLSSARLSDLYLQTEGFSCLSSGKAPYAVFRLGSPLRGTTSNKLGDPWALGIFLVSVFIIAFALSRTFLTGKERKNWLYWSDSGLVLLLAVFSFVPMSHIDRNEISVEEKRKLAEYKPLITDAGKINYRYGKDFEAWFNDHFLGRSVLLNFNVFLSKPFFSAQSSSKVFHGPDNWLFFAGDHALRNFHNLDVLPEDKLARAADDLNFIGRIRGGKGKKTYLLIAPDKHKVYGEYFPVSAKMRPDSQGRAKLFELAMRKNASGTEVLYLGDTLIENRDKGLLYLKHDTHWNEMGAYIGYLEFMRHVRKSFPDVPVCSVERIVRERGKKAKKDLESFDVNTVPDTTLYPRPVFNRKYKTVEVVEDSHDRPALIRMENPSGKYNLLIVRDSFCIALLPYLGNSFKSVTALWINDYQLPKDKIKLFREADIVVWECIERYLPIMVSAIHILRINLERGVR